MRIEGVGRSAPSLLLPAFPIYPFVGGCRSRCRNREGSVVWGLCECHAMPRVQPHEGGAFNGGEKCFSFQLLLLATDWLADVAVVPFLFFSFSNDGFDCINLAEGSGVPKEGKSIYSTLLLPPKKRLCVESTQKKLDRTGVWSIENAANEMQPKGQTKT